jgi:8-oxo-dGTP pyrophosphatase MutT (NUDIX family)
MPVLRYGTSTLLIAHDGRLWLAERTAHKPRLAGLLECPGGELEAYEGNHEGAAREVREETGLEIDERRFKYHGHIKVRDWYVNLYTVELEADERPKDTEPEKRTPWRLVDVNEIQNRSACPGLSALAGIFIDERRG